MKKKPTKRTRSNEKKTKPILNVLSPLHPLYRQPIPETKVSIGDLYRFFKSEQKKNRLTMKKIAKISARKRKENPEDYEHYDWWAIGVEGRKIYDEHPSYTRNRIAKKIHDEKERVYPSDEIPSVRSIWKHLDFIPTLKRTPK
jgi:hypothetical protein